MSQIGFVGDVVSHNIGLLVQVANALAARASVEAVDGDRNDPAARQVTNRFIEVSTSLGDSVENLRTFISEKADGLAQAAQALQQSDELTADDARQATSLIDDLVAAPPAAGASIAPTNAPGAGSTSGESEASSDYSGS